MITGILIILPLVFSLILFSVKDEKWIRTLAISATVAEFILSVYTLVLYVTQCHCKLLLDLGWSSSLGISLRFGMDGISLLLVLLTTFLLPLIVASSFRHHYRKPSAFYGLILLMETAFIGLFSAFDGLVFYIFWELALIPAWFICAVWGGNDRIRITFKFFVYTFTGSLFMLAALIWLYLRTPLPIRSRSGPCMLHHFLQVNRPGSLQAFSWLLQSRSPYSRSIPGNPIPIPKPRHPVPCCWQGSC